MATTYEHSTANVTTDASTRTMVYWIVGIIAALLILAYSMRTTGPATDSSVYITPPVDTVPAK